MIPTSDPEVKNQPEPGLVFRRYRLADGRTVETFEIPATVARGFGMQRLHAGIDAWCRGEEKRARSARLLADITARLDAGTKPTAIAHELGCTEAYVRAVRTPRKKPKG